MKLLEQLFLELGGEPLKTFVIQPSFGGYFRGVKNIDEYSSEKIILRLGGEVVTIEGEKLELCKYFQADAFVRGAIKGVKIE